MAPTSKKKPAGRNQKPDGPKLNKASKQPFKKKERNSSNGAIQSSSLALQLDDDVPDFPRGGGSSLSRREREEIHAEVDEEFAAEERQNKNKSTSNTTTLKTKKDKKGKKLKLSKNVADGGDDFGYLFSDSLTGKLPRFANRITPKNITPGMKLWGVVIEVNEKDLIISLPGGLRGLVRSADTMDPLSDDADSVDSEGSLPSKFYVGQLVSCTVLQLDDDKKDSGKKKIWLSLRLSLLHKGLSLDAVQEGMSLTAYAKSVEDHGYMLHFGLPSFTGFLPKNNQAEDHDCEVKPGQLLQGIVKRIDKTRKVVYLSSDPDTLAKSVMKDLKGISIDLLVPGMMVNARVQSTLENGILLSFLAYFTGTVDIFHLQNSFPSSNWKDDYPKNKKVNARILFVDPSTRAIGLTLNQYLVRNNAPPSHIKVGDIFDNAKVLRVDKGMGLQLEIPSTPVSTPAYVSISDAAEDEVRKLEKKFQEGSNVRVRILGFKHLEGLAMGILKASAFEGSVFTHSDVKPGMVIRAKIIAVDSFGAIVQFPGGMKALCPLSHMSEFEIAKPRKKFKVGAELLFRVLGCKSKRITVTHKKSLVKSKLPILCSYSDANDGLITHGWITKIEKHGCFVHFYNGVQGFAPRSELGLEPGSDASSSYQVGQVIKCRVISSFAASRRINISIIMKPSRVSDAEDVKLGSVVSAVVEKVTPFSVIVYVNAKSYMKGTISTEHLADHHEHATLMKSVLKPGHEFDQLIILDIGSSNLILSAKNSLIKSAHQLPSDLSQIVPQPVVHGYICNIIETGCFVRFLGNLTGFSPRSKALDDQRAQLSDVYYTGQSVRCNIHDVNVETARITVSLKQSCCSSTDASLLRGFFLTDEKIAELQSSDTRRTSLNWAEGFNIGSVIEGRIQEAKEFGVVVSFDKYNDVFGFITQYQLGGTQVQVGSTVRAAVLDIAKTERLVDLSLKLDLFDKSRDLSSQSQTHKRKRKRELSKDLDVHQTVNAIVEVVKENYLVVSLPDHNYCIGFAAQLDYNTLKLPKKQFLNGQSVVATVASLPGPPTAGRLLLLLKSISQGTESSGSKKAKKKSSYTLGSLVQAEITEMKPLEMRLKFGIGFHGRIHITEVNDDCVTENPFSSFRIGQTVTARIIAKANQSDNKKSQLWELSIRPKKLTDSCEIGDKLLIEEFEYSSGQCVTGFVYKVEGDWAWLTISRLVKAQLFILDSGYEPSDLEEFNKWFCVGKAVTGHVLSYNKEKALLRLVLRPLCVVSNSHIDGNTMSTNDAQKSVTHDNHSAHIHEGDVVGGRVSKILPGVGGLLVQVGPRMHGRAHFTELQDSWVPDPLSGYHEGQFVKCKVLEVSQSVNGTIHVDLSLRMTLDGMLHNSMEFSNKMDTPNKRVERIEDLCSNMVVQGYVKNITSKGCFISLSRKLDAKILLSNLSGGFVQKPEEEFPVGKLVIGRVLSVEPLSKRVEVSLKELTASSAAKSEINDFSKLHVGDVISGQIRRVELYGLFITIENTSMVGLCHMSELPDSHPGNIGSKFKAGDKVTARILKVDEERHRISLSMKNLEVADDTQEESDEAISENGSLDDSDSNLIIFPQSSLLGNQNGNMECETEECSVLAQAESRASVPPLEVTLDDMELPDVHDLISQNERRTNEVEANEKSKGRGEKKPNKLSEQEISAAEEKMLEINMPKTADDFEKLVRLSPNNSGYWMMYMALMVSLAVVEKARSLAERALKTINFREENEKLNIWVAYFNLERKHGNPPEEAAKTVFQRALQHCDPKKLHLALLQLYEDTKQDNLADELLNKMTKKFKKSCMVWPKRILWLLKQGQDGVQPVVTSAILSLPKHKHIKFIRQTAIQEFKFGVPDRGRSLFEEILRKFPMRVDIWSVYLDQEIKLGDVDATRALFERAIGLSLPPKKIKSLFKKYLEYEKAHGDEGRIEHVKDKAMDYVKHI